MNGVEYTKVLYSISSLIRSTMGKFYSEDDTDGAWTLSSKRRSHDKESKWGYLKLKPANWLDSRRK